jgi:hypothetical protein
MLTVLSLLGLFSVDIGKYFITCIYKYIYLYIYIYKYLHVYIYVYVSMYIDI